MKDLENVFCPQELSPYRSLPASQLRILSSSCLRSSCSLCLSSLCFRGGVGL